MLSRYLRVGDTSRVLAPYLRSTAGVKYTDTANMLSQYARRVELPNMAAKLNTSDTGSMLAGYAKRGELPDISTKLNYTDTTALLAGYVRKAELPDMAVKLNIADTVSMLSGYARKTELPNISGKLNISDTASMLSAYVRSTAGVKYTDTAAMLSTYLLKADTSRFVRARALSDTASLLRTLISNVNTRFSNGTGYLRITGGNVGYDNRNFMPTTGGAFSGAISTPLITMNNSSNSVPLTINTSGTNIGSQINFNNQYLTGAYLGIAADQSGDFTFYSAGGGTGYSKGFKMVTSGLTRLFLSGGGDIGIGTEQPSHRLTVNGNMRVTSDVTFSALSGSGLRMVVVDSIGRFRTQALSSTNGQGLDSAAISRSFLPLSGGTLAGPLQMTSATVTGNLGIGVTNPTERLVVNGNIRAKRLIITQAGWPDYVFAADYKLRSIESLKSFIQENKHLPGVPSAEYIYNKGVDVGDVQAALLEKVEELTLYLIQQSEEINRLKKEVQTLKGKSIQRVQKRK